MKRVLIFLVAITACIAAWAAESYAIFTPNNNTLTFYFGDKPDGAYSLNGSFPEWQNDGTFAVVTRVVFDSSFAQARPTSTAYWFYNMGNLTLISNLNYLNTSSVILMQNMFAGCKKLTGLDLSSFNTSQVSNMSWMFDNCSSLASIYLNNFNTSQVTRMISMFNGCENLTSLDLSSFDTSNVTFMSSMFNNCSGLKTVTVSSAWNTSAVTNSQSMFYNCTSLVGGAGTTYSPSHTDASYAHIDGGPSNPGYFIGAIEEFDLWINGVQVTNANCYNLSNIYGVSGTVTYNPSSKTLTLENARLSCGETSNGACIRSLIDGLTINVMGTSSILITPSGTNMNGMVLSNTTITGTDTLGVQGRKSGITILSGKTLTINNLHSLIARGSYGIYASSSSNTRLVVKGRGTNVVAIGGSGAIRNMDELVLEDGLRITEPVGGYFAGGILYDASGNVATRATISGLLGDVNSDGFVTSADVTAIYDVLLGTDNQFASTADVNGDGFVTSADVTAVYDILLSN